MHILIITSEHYLTQSYPLGGIFQYHQARGLIKFGCKVGVISTDILSPRVFLKKYTYLRHEVQDRINIYREYKKSIIPSFFLKSTYVRRQVYIGVGLFQKYISENGIPDVIHAHNCLYAGVVACNIKRRYKIPYIITEHSSAYGRKCIKDWQIDRIQEVFDEAEYKSAVSFSLANDIKSIIKTDFNDDEIINNIIDEKFESEVIADQDSSNGPFIFLTIANLDVNKNTEGLINAFAMQFKGNDKFKLVIGGDGELRNELMGLCLRLGIMGQVKFEGVMTRERVIKSIKESNVLVLPSMYETFGVVLIEAMALGKPVISTDSGGPREIINESNGILVPINDIQALSNGLLYMYENIKKYNPIEIRNECILKYGQRSYISKLLDIYTAAINMRNNL